MTDAAAQAVKNLRRRGLSCVHPDGKKYYLIVTCPSCCADTFRIAHAHGVRVGLERGAKIAERFKGIPGVAGPVIGMTAHEIATALRQAQERTDG